LSFFCPLLSEGPESYVKGSSFLITKSANCEIRRKEGCSMAILLKNVQIVDVVNLEIFRGWLLTEGNKIREVGRGDCSFSLEKCCDKVIDAQGLFCSPGLVDIQVNGAMGTDFSVSPGWLSNAGAIWQLVKNGVVSILPTIVTSSVKGTQGAIEKIIQARQYYPVLKKLILGIHLEGPYISTEPGPRGAHNIEHIRQSDMFEYEAWRKIVGPDFLLIITLAPELVASESFMAGVRVRDERDGSRTIFLYGHSNATAQDVKNTERFASGATHLLNAWYKMLDKKDLKYPGQVVCNKELWASFIPCPHHFPDPNTLKMLIRAKGIEKSILVTDAMAATGMPDGLYCLGDQQVLVQDGAARLLKKGQDDKEEKRLAGSILLMNQAVANAVNIFGFSLAEAIRMASFNPAQLLGLEKETGSLEPGKKANLILFGWKGEEEKKKSVVYKTMFEGEMVYQNPRF